MSRKPETVFIESVHDHIEQGYPYHMKNSNDYIGGIPDVWYSGKVADIWVEYKWLDKIPNSREIKLALTKLQFEWLEARYYENRRVFVILGTPDGGVIFKDMEWTKTFTQRELTERVVSRKEVAYWLAMQTCGRYDAPAPRGRKLRRTV